MASSTARKDYYKILEITKTATDVEIKQAYRSLAMRWHPDKNRDNQEMADRKFKEIAEAYQVLSDKSLRREYDNASSFGAGIKEFDLSSASATFSAADELFRDLFGDKTVMEALDQLINDTGPAGQRSSSSRRYNGSSQRASNSETGGNGPDNSSSLTVAEAASWLFRTAANAAYNYYYKKPEPSPPST
jgi:DnaJ-class molecular chaperone